MENNYIEWSYERLEARKSDIEHRMAIIAYRGVRLAQNTSELNNIDFELACRYKEQYDYEVDLAWNDLQSNKV